MTEPGSSSRIRRILFVDDEERVLMGIRRQLHSMRDQWTVKTAMSGAAALEMLAQEPVDVVVSDMRMPGMDGAEFLMKVMERWPQTVRIILSGQADRESILRSFSATHQYLAKPCDPERLRAVVGRACALRDILYEREVQAYVASMETIPSIPSLYEQIQAEIQKPEPDLGLIGQTVSQDPGMSAKLLQIVNSARFGLTRQVNSAAEAVKLLGISTVKSLVLSCHIFNELKATPELKAGMDRIWGHSLVVGCLARMIAKDLGQTIAQTELAYTAGILHDCGRVMLAANDPQAYAEILATDVGTGRISDLERAVFRVDHAIVGAYLLGLWGLPEPIVEAVAFHHTPRVPGHAEKSPLLAVHVADALWSEQESPGRGGRLDDEWIASLDVPDLTERIRGWRAAIASGNIRL